MRIIITSMLTTIRTGADTDPDDNAETEGKNTGAQAGSAYNPSTKIAGDDMNSSNVINDETDNGTDKNAVHERMYHLPSSLTLESE